MIGDYENELSHRRWEPATGTGDANEVVPTDAWVTEISVVAPTSGDTTITITRVGKPSYDAITVRDAGTITVRPYDRGQLAGATIAIVNAQDYVIQYARAV